MSTSIFCCSKSAYVLSVLAGGLRGNYFDNVWMMEDPVKTQIDSTIDLDWDTGVLTTYGTDWVTARWIGKVHQSVLSHSASAPILHL